MNLGRSSVCICAWVVPALIASSVLVQAAPYKSGAQSTTLQSGAQSTTLQTSAQSTTLQTGAQSTTLQSGAQSTTLQSGTRAAFIQGQVQEESGPINVLFLLDCSYSMKEGLGGGVKKMDAAKQVLESAINRIPTDINVGLRVFGQGFSNDPYIDCQQSALLVPLGQGNRRAIIERTRNVHPFGLTPLTYALTQAEKDFRGVEGSRTIILISDGAETCGGNPCQYIRRLAQLGIKLKVDIVGLGLRHDRAAREQLNCIAQSSGGKYYDANSARELIDSISKSVNKAISGRIITRGARPLTNAVTPVDVETQQVVVPSRAAAAPAAARPIVPPDASVFDKLLGK